MKQVAVYGFHAPELAAAVRQATEGRASIAYWVGVNRPDHQFEEDITDWHLGKIFLPDASSFDRSEWEFAGRFLEPHRGQLREQLVRNPGCVRLSDDELSALGQRLFLKFLAIQRERQISQIIFQNLPHEGFEFALYLAARALKVATVMCYQSILPYRFFYCRDLDDFGLFRTCTRHLTSQVQIPNGFEKDLFYMKTATGQRIQKSSRVLSAVVRRRFVLRGIKQRLGYYRLRGTAPRVDADEEYAWNLDRVIDRRFDFHRVPFVYFPLHLQPELTTSAIGGPYYDQVLAIEELSARLPRGWWLVVKENPKQDYRWRSPEFFRRIRMLRNVKWLPTETDTYELLEASRIAATVTGTVGWEAITGGRPVIVFGRPWYLTLPGVVPWSETVNIESAAELNWSHEALQMATQSLVELGRAGIVDVNYRKSLTSYDPQLNSRDVADFLTEILET